MTTTYFTDSFAGKTLNSNHWAPGFPGDPSGFVGWPGSYDVWKNESVQVSDRLLLHLAQGAANGKNAAGIVTSYQKFHAHGGWIQAQIAFPPGNGIWPAFWLLPASYVGSGRIQNWEIDLEYLGNGDAVYYTLHKGGDQVAQWIVHNPQLSLAHDYTFNWAPGKFLKFYFDGHLVGHTANQSMIPNEPMFMLLNINTGGWNNNAVDGSTPKVATMICNYVAVLSN